MRADGLVLVVENVLYPLRMIESDYSITVEARREKNIEHRAKSKATPICLTGMKINH